MINVGHVNDLIHLQIFHVTYVNNNFIIPQIFEKKIQFYIKRFDVGNYKYFMYLPTFKLKTLSIGIAVCRVTAPTVP